MVLLTVLFKVTLWAISSVIERFVDIEEATGLIPVSPTIKIPSTTLGIFM